MNISIRVLNKSKDEVEVSWQSSEAIESYRILTRKILENFLSSWEVFIYKNSGGDSETRKRISQEKVNSQIQRQLKQKSKTLESILFGDLWYVGGILPGTMDEIDSFYFITDLDWSGLPFEILSVLREDFSPIAVNFPVRRRIRSRNLPKKGKSGKGFLLWLADGNQISIQSSLLQERKDLESYLDSVDVDCSSHRTASFPSNSFIQELNHAEFLHFAGHSEKDHIPFRNNERMLWSDFSNMDLSNLKIAFVNSCYSGMQSANSSGMVASFLESGVEQFIGFSNVVDTDKAQAIGIKFWEMYFTFGSVNMAILNLRKYAIDRWGSQNLIPYILIHFSQSALEMEKSASVKLPNSKENLLSKKQIRFSIGIGLGLVAVGIMLLGWLQVFNKDTSQNSGSMRKLEKTKIEIESNIIERKVRSKQATHHPTIKSTSKDSNTRKVEIPTIPKKSNSDSKESHLNTLIDSLESKEFRQNIVKFLKSPHPYYSVRDRRNLVEKILVNRHESEEVMEWKFQKLLK